MDDLIERLRREADISARPGQMDRLNALADEFAAALEAAREDADKCAATLPGPCYMDPPDGGDVPVHEQLRRMGEDAARYRWLRDPCSGAERVIFYCRGDYGKGLMSGAMLDAAIDQAREKGGRNG